MIGPGTSRVPGRVEPELKLVTATVILHIQLMAAKTVSVIVLTLKTVF